MQECKNEKNGILLVYVTPSGKGLKVVFKADAERGNLIDNQLWLAGILGVKADEGCKDASRRSYLTTERDILYMNKDELFSYENREFAERYNTEYRNGHSAGVKTNTNLTNQTNNSSAHNSCNSCNSCSEENEGSLP